MLKIEKFVTMSPEQYEIVIEGMRNPKNSWHLIDSYFYDGPEGGGYEIGEKDHDLMMRLAKGGPVHAKYRRMMPVWVTINAPLYWWKEFDTMKVGTVCNSCSTMHKIHAKEFTLEDFSCEHLDPLSIANLEGTILVLNLFRTRFIEKYSDDPKNDWWQMIQLLPTSYNQKRTIMLNYEVLVNIYKWRKNHKLDCWHTFCSWVEELPYSELITMEENE